MVQFLVTVAPAATHGSVASLRGTVDVRRGRRLCNDNNHLRITYDSLRSDLAKVDAHVIQPHEYDQLPELTDEMMARAVFKRGGRPITANPRQQVTIRLPADVLARWKDSGPSWQTRMAEFLAKKAPKAKRAAWSSRWARHGGLRGRTAQRALGHAAAFVTTKQRNNP